MPKILYSIQDFGDCYPGTLQNYGMGPEQ